MLAASGRAAVRRVAGRRGASTHASHGHGSAHTAAPAHPPAQHGGRTALAHELEEEAHATGTITHVLLPLIFVLTVSYFSEHAHLEAHFVCRRASRRRHLRVQLVERPGP
mgnify:CR=1 FL=1